MLPYNQKYIVWDLETEGLNLRYSRPWELSYLVYQGTKLIKKRQIYIALDDFNLSPLIRKLCNFDERKYNTEKVSPKEAWLEFKNLLYDPNYKIVGQNILKYDINILKILCEMCEEELDFSFIDRILDTRPLALAHRCDLEKPRKGDIVEWQYKVLNDRDLKARVSQSALLKYFGIEHDPNLLHDGLYDCQMTWEVFKCLKKCLEI